MAQLLIVHSRMSEVLGHLKYKGCVRGDLFYIALVGLGW